MWKEIGSNGFLWFFTIIKVVKVGLIEKFTLWSLRVSSRSISRPFKAIFPLFSQFQFQFRAAKLNYPHKQPNIPNRTFWIFFTAIHAGRCFFWLKKLYRILKISKQFTFLFTLFLPCFQWNFREIFTIRINHPSIESNILTNFQKLQKKLGKSCSAIDIMCFPYAFDGFHWNSSSSEHNFHTISQFYSILVFSWKNPRKCHHFSWAHKAASICIWFDLNNYFLASVGCNWIVNFYS